MAEVKIKKLIDDQIGPLRQKVEDLESKLAKLEHEADDRRRREQQPQRQRLGD
jgi:hypothetical protein